MTRILGTGPISLARAAITRALRTAAQTAVALIGVATQVDAVDWKVVASSSALAGLVSVLTSIASPPPETGTVIGTIEHIEPAP